MSILISVVLFDSNFDLSSDKNVLGNSGNIDLDNEEQIRAVMDLFADKTYANMWTSSTNQLDDSNVPSGEQISGDAPMPSLDNPPSTIEPPAPDVGPEVASEVGPDVAPDSGVQKLLRLVMSRLNKINQTRETLQGLEWNRWSNLLLRKFVTSNRNPKRRKETLGWLLTPKHATNR